jgi:hypothetical protein
VERGIDVELAIMLLARNDGQIPGESEQNEIHGNQDDVLAWRLYVPERRDGSKVKLILKVTGLPAIGLSNATSVAL